MNMAAAQPARAYTHTCEPLVACVIERKGPPLQFIQQTTNNPCGGRVRLPDVPEEILVRGEGVGRRCQPHVQYSFSQGTVPSHRQETPRPIQAYRVWRRVGVPETHTHKKKKVACRRPPRSKQPAAGEERWWDTCLANYYLLQVGSNVGGYVRYRPLGCVPTNRFVRPGLVNFDRAPGPLHPTPRQFCWKCMWKP